MFVSGVAQATERIRNKMPATMFCERWSRSMSPSGRRAQWIPYGRVKRTPQRHCQRARHNWLRPLRAQWSESTEGLGVTPERVSRKYSAFLAHIVASSMSDSSSSKVSQWLWRNPQRHGRRTTSRRPRAPQDPAGPQPAVENFQGRRRERAIGKTIGTIGSPMPRP